MPWKILFRHYPVYPVVPRLRAAHTVCVVREEIKDAVNPFRQLAGLILQLLSEGQTVDAENTRGLGLVFLCVG